MLGDLLTAVALLLIIEGLMPALNPGAWRRTVEQISRLPDRTVRTTGIGLVLAGALMFHLVR